MSTIPIQSNQHQPSSSSSSSSSSTTDIYSNSVNNSSLFTQAETKSFQGFLSNLVNNPLINEDDKHNENENMEKFTDSRNQDEIQKDLNQDKSLKNLSNIRSTNNLQLRSPSSTSTPPLSPKSKLPLSLSSHLQSSIISSINPFSDNNINIQNQYQNSQNQQIYHHDQKPPSIISHKRANTIEIDHQTKSNFIPIDQKSQQIRHHQSITRRASHQTSNHHYPHSNQNHHHIYHHHQASDPIHHYLPIHFNKQINNQTQSNDNQNSNKTSNHLLKEDQTPWIHQSGGPNRHRHHLSLDSSSTPLYFSNQESLKQQINNPSNKLLTPNPQSLPPSFGQRSLSDSSGSSQTNCPLRTTSSSSSPTMSSHSANNNLNQETDSNLNSHIKKLKPRLPSGLTAIPASILKKEKPGLLSQEQKRANHIASEQKRRAAIRHGYGRLCLVVPSLRTPIGNEQWMEKKSDEESGEDLKPGLKSNGKENAKVGIAPKRKRKKGESVETRSGAKSEAVVLAKTVEYLRELEIERSDLIERLKKGENIAIKNGIEIRKSNQERLWQERWKGEKGEESLENVQKEQKEYDDFVQVDENHVQFGCFGTMGE
ncbi:hypothetical protein O181_011559 [Austropuccinia psidii MF-1]|uniref:BHLH domain-containing protein n=1 Tax=Austropuccinia psidii MF-1 TaxID=1389203 RepID=A0A9Q3BUP2_9BASI|nr:hypothetical protein [Austropuccinia psidii MF-1]